jgi:hypothetical protein
MRSPADFWALSEEIGNGRKDHPFTAPTIAASSVTAQFAWKAADGLRIGSRTAEGRQ